MSIDHQSVKSEVVLYSRESGYRDIHVLLDKYNIERVVAFGPPEVMLEHTGTEIELVVNPLYRFRSRILELYKVLKSLVSEDLYRSLAVPFIPLWVVITSKTCVDICSEEERCNRGPRLKIHSEIR